MIECTLKLGEVVPLRSDNKCYNSFISETRFIERIGCFCQDDWDLFLALCVGTKWSLDIILDTVCAEQSDRINASDVNKYISVFLENIGDCNIADIISENLDKEEVTKRLFSAGYLVEGEEGFWKIG